MIKIIKKHLLKRCLEKHNPTRVKKIIPLEQVRSMGILCQIMDEDSYKEIHELFSKLQSPNRTVWLMAYINKKEVPYFCLPQLSADYFSKKQLNWYGKPTFVQLNDFLQKDFDMLIDFSREDFSPLQYILTTTNGKLIIGANKHTKELYDIYIQDETELSPITLLKTIYNYLHKLTGQCNP